MRNQQTVETEAASMAEVVNGGTLQAASEEPAEVAPKYEAFSDSPTHVQRKFFGNSAEIWTDARADFGGQNREHFIVYFLDVRHRLIGERWTAAIGSATGVEVHPREIFREAVQRGAVCLIMLHNHPSGDPSPSRQDLELTDRLVKAGELLGIAVLDHIVIAAEGFISIAARGLTFGHA